MPRGMHPSMHPTFYTRSRTFRAEAPCYKSWCINLRCFCKLQGKYMITPLLELWVITPGLSVIITDEVLLMQLSGRMFTQQSLPCLRG